MHTKLWHTGFILLVAVVATLAGACDVGGGPAPTPAPTATPWVIIVTATPSGPPSPEPSPTTGPVPTAPPVLPTPTRPRPTPTPPPPEPNPPVVSVLNPPNGTQYVAGQTVSVDFTAGDQSGITRVELYVGNDRVWYNDYPQRPTYIPKDTLKWVASATGNYTLRVIAYDAFNKTGMDQRNITVIRTINPPTVRIDYPTQRVVIVAGQTITIKATINSEASIKSLDLVERTGGQERVFASDNSYHNPPFQWQMGWLSSTPGDHTLFVRARDTSGNVGQSADFVVGVTDNDPPRIQAGYSATALNVGSDLRVHVEAVDSKGVKELRLIVDGNRVDQWFAPDPGVGLSHASVDLWWRNVGPAGGHTAYVWGVDTVGNQAQTPGQGIQVLTIPPTPTPWPTPTPTPPPPSVMGRWGATLDPTTQFALHITSQEGGVLRGQFTRLPENETADFHDSTIAGYSVTIHATVFRIGGSGPTYNFMLTLSGDGQRLSGQWSTSDMGLLQPITFTRLIGQ